MDMAKVDKGKIDEKKIKEQVEPKGDKVQEELAKVEIFEKFDKMRKARLEAKHLAGDKCPNSRDKAPTKVTRNPEHCVCPRYKPHVPSGIAPGINPPPHEASASLEHFCLGCFSLPPPAVDVNNALAVPLGPSESLFSYTDGAVGLHQDTPGSRRRYNYPPELLSSAEPNVHDALRREYPSNLDIYCKRFLGMRRFHVTELLSQYDLGTPYDSRHTDPEGGLCQSAHIPPRLMRKGPGYPRAPNNRGSFNMTPQSSSDGRGLSGPSSSGILSQYRSHHDSDTPADHSTPAYANSDTNRFEPSDILTNLRAVKQKASFQPVHHYYRMGSYRTWNSSATAGEFLAAGGHSREGYRESLIQGLGRYMNALELTKTASPPTNSIKKEDTFARYGLELNARRIQEWDQGPLDGLYHPSPRKVPPTIFRAGVIWDDLAENTLAPVIVKKEILHQNMVYSYKRQSADLG